MKLKKNELPFVNRFISEEVVRSIDLTYSPPSVKNCFNIKQKYGLFNNRKKE